MKILVTGGSGYVGSHTLLQLLKARHEVSVLDNFSNSSPEAMTRVKRLANAEFQVNEGDIRDTRRLDEVFSAFKPEAVIHLAGLKAVGESSENPMEYYAQNVSGSVNLLKAMKRHDCRRLVFSSSACVYGVPEYLPYDENHPIQPTNPYARTKHFIEEIIRDWTNSSPGTGAVVLRYFNPAGADASGQIGEDPNGVPNNLVPFIAQVAVGRFAHLNIFGTDYPTRDGTGERDYIHVDDLARAHLAAIEYAAGHQGFEAINIGTGQSATVFEMLAAFERVSGQKIPYKTGPRRAGDVARMLAAVNKAERLFGWKAERGLDDMCRSAWQWQSGNPSGYEE